MTIPRSLAAQPDAQHPLSSTLALRRAAAYVRLVRLSNSVPAALLVLLGATLAGGLPLPGAAWRAAAAMWCVTGFGYASNDWFDRAEDAINKPDRPLPAGAISPAVALWLALALACGALLLAAAIGAAPFAVALAVLALLTWYNMRLKSSAGGGNLLVALLAGTTLVVGSVAVLGLRPAALAPVWASALLLAAFIAAREIVKTVEDMAGDRAAGKETFAVRWGAGRAVQAVAALTCLVAALSVYPVWALGYSPIYWMTLTLGVTAPLAYTVAVLARDARPPRPSRCLALLKASYFAGLLALLLA